jgi:hypothetical protein
MVGKRSATKKMPDRKTRPKTSDRISERIADHDRLAVSTMICTTAKWRQRASRSAHQHVVMTSMA